MKTVEYQNIKFYIGNNAIENWKLFDDTKIINPDYFWFHLNSFPSPYVIMYASMKELKAAFNSLEINQILIFASNLCKNNSKYKNFSNLKIIYTTLQKLSKSDTVGEVIIKGRKNIITL